VGLYVRLRIEETPAFRLAIANNERVRLPMVSVLKSHSRVLLLGTFAATATFVLFYLMTVFTLSWGTASLGYSRQQFLILQMIGVVFFGAAIPLSAWLADKIGARTMLIIASAAIAVFGWLLAPLLGSGNLLSVLACLSLGLALMGLTYGPIGSGLASLFPTSIRYTGASLAFNLAGIVGASMAPYAATWLATYYGLQAVGYYLCAAGLVSLIALLLLGRKSMTIEESV
jgi:MFS family permease